MRLFLIRHGETVDNIAGVYAGVKDSQLTVHGLEQTRKLGEYLATQQIVVTHVFSSPLIRAVKTAQAIIDAQLKPNPSSSLGIVEDANLIEQDFGFYEGKPFYARQSPGKTGRRSHAESHSDDSGFVDVESKEAMCRRADAFLDKHLFPVRSQSSDIEPVVVIVSHGMLLGNLWRRILLRIPKKALIIAPEITAERGSLILEHLGGWSNTGYLELAITALPVPSTITPDPKPTSTVEEELKTATAPQDSEPLKSFAGHSVTILAIDSKKHLIGLKRQRGGIGRLAHDDTQKKLDSFFKRAKKA